jgi:hypothetical protein
MIKTLYDIESDLYSVCKAFFKDAVSGETYREDCRPANSNKEDVVCIVSFATADQIQEGDCLVDIFVNDITSKGNRRQTDKKRVGEVSSLDEELVEALNDELVGEYTWELSRATNCSKLHDTNQHYVTIHLQFKRKTF